MKRVGAMSRNTAALLLCITGLLGKAVACPSLCRCRTSGRVHCGGLGLTSFPPLKDVPPNTTFIDLSSNQIQDVSTGFVAQLKELKTLKLSSNRIERIPRFSAHGNLQILSLDNNNIRKIESGAFDGLDKLFELNLIGNHVESFPHFAKPSSLKNLYLNRNPEITSLSKPSLENLPELSDLEMEETDVRELPDYIFSKNKQLVSLTFKNSLLETIGEKAFVGADSLRTLILDNTKITSLSSLGLRNLRRLSLSGVKNFWQIEPGFASIEEVDVSEYNSHLCCAFHLKLYQRDYAKLDKSVGNEHSTHVISTTIATFFSSIFTASTSPPTSAASTTVSMSTITAGQSGNQTMNSTTVAPTITTTEDDGWGRRRRRRDLPKTTDSGGFPGGGGFVPGTTSSTRQSPASTKSNHGFTIPGFMTGTVHVSTRILHGNKTNESVHTAPPPEDVVCRPESDAFHPCEDLMGASWLTVLCFMVGAVALVANLVVMVVIILSEKRFNVTKFLMCNLACADFCLGLYLFLLVCVSMDTTGQYYNYVRSWQYGAGCKATGFLAVFSTELSVYTLALITVERFMAIAYAMQRNLRLSLRKASKAMVFGWLFALLMATLPLVGVNSYEKVAICLPFDIDTPGALVYVSALLLINGGVFLTVAGMYVKMFLVVAAGPGHMDVGGPQRNDAKVAKRMALLVATDFVCWAPIAMFGLMAAFGQQAIGVTYSKILLVFFFPLNSLCNPFLYAFFTKAFKREFYSLLSRCGFCKTRALRYRGTFSSLMYSRSRTKRSTTVDEDAAADRKSKRSISASYSEMRMSALSFTGNVSSGVPYPLAQKEDISMTAFSNLGYGKDDVFQLPSATSSSGVQNPMSNVNGNCAAATNGHVNSSLSGSAMDSSTFPGKKATSEGKNAKKISVSFKEQDENVTRL